MFDFMNKKQQQPIEETRRKKAVEEEDIDEAGANDWLATYSDMITLLMAFFVIFFSASKVDIQLFEELKNGFVSDKLNTKSGSPLTMLYNQLDSTFDNSANDNPRVEIEKNYRGINILLGSESLFSSGESNLTMGGRQTIDELCSSLDSIVGKYNLTMDIEGHTDDTPIKSFRFPSNWELSSARAATVLRQMIENGLPPENSRAIGFADVRPTVKPFDEEGKYVKGSREKNRRVEIIIHY
jgi:chemotaxis protein MotB